MSLWTDRSSRRSFVGSIADIYKFIQIDYFFATDSGTDEKYCHWLSNWRWHRDRQNQIHARLYPKTIKSACTYQIKRIHTPEITSHPCDFDWESFESERVYVCVCMFMCVYVCASVGVTAISCWCVWVSVYALSWNCRHLSIYLYLGVYI